MKTVLRYSRTGAAESLAQLRVARYHHACGSYNSDSGHTVLLVVGGKNEFGKFDSTEILEADTAWRLTARLPTARYGLRAATLENYIFISGEKHHKRYLISISTLSISGITM